MRRHPLLPGLLQERLLQASFLPPAEARRSWRVAEAELELERLPPGTFCLLPLLATRADELGIEDALDRRLQGIRRSVSYRRHLAVAKLASAVEGLAAAGIDVALFGNTAAAVRTDDSAIRAVPRLELLAAPGRRPDAVQALAGHGWSVRERLPHGTVLADAEHLLLVAEWPLTDFPPAHDGPGSVVDVWAAARRPGDLALDALCLAPEDQLLFACLDGATPRPWRTVDWAVVAATVIATAEGSIDWQRLVERAQALGAVESVSRGLTYLARATGAEVDERALAGLSAVRISAPERLAEWSAGETARRIVPRVAAAYLRAQAQQGRPDRRVTTFLRDAWELPPSTSLVRAGAARVGRRLRRGGGIGLRAS